MSWLDLLNKAVTGVTSLVRLISGAPDPAKPIPKPRPNLTPHDLGWDEEPTTVGESPEVKK